RGTALAARKQERIPPLQRLAEGRRAQRQPSARSAVVPLEEARSSSLGWKARAKAQRIVTSSAQSELEPLTRRKVGACAIGRRVEACLSYVASVRKTSRCQLINSKNWGRVARPCVLCEGRESHPSKNEGRAPRHHTPQLPRRRLYAITSR